MTKVEDLYLSKKATGDESSEKKTTKKRGELGVAMFVLAMKGLGSIIAFVIMAWVLLTWIQPKMMSGVQQTAAQNYANMLNASGYQDFMSAYSDAAKGIAEQAQSQESKFDENAKIIEEGQKEVAEGKARFETELAASPVNADDAE